MCNTPLERCFQDISNGILQASKFQKFQVIKPKKICSCLATAEQVGQKNCNGKTTIFCKCIKGKSGICLLLPMFIGEDLMVNLMIIYIKKIIAKALDFNHIIKKFMGMSAH
jgi:hypothetical protein